MGDSLLRAGPFIPGSQTPFGNPRVETPFRVQYCERRTFVKQSFNACVPKRRGCEIIEDSASPLSQRSYFFRTVGQVRVVFLLQCSSLSLGSPSLPATRAF